MENQLSKAGKPCNCRRGMMIAAAVFALLFLGAFWFLIRQYNAYAG
jgi:hypothetical protein